MNIDSKIAKNCILSNDQQRAVPSIVYHFGSRVVPLVAKISQFL